MNKTIYVDPYDPSSYDAAIREIKAYKEWVKEKSMELCKRLADIGLSVAQIYFIPSNGNTDVTLSVEPLNNGYMLRADGADVCFMEFGAGVTAGLGYDTSQVTPPVDISPGSWSEAHNGPFFKSGGYPHGSWYYQGQQMNSIVPQMGMAHAVKEITQRIEQVAQEVFA